MAESHELQAERTLTPVPDPTTLTSAALVREIASLKEIVFTRLDGMDRALVLFRETITRAPTDTDKQIGHLKEYTVELMKGHEAGEQERFASVARQFEARDKQTSESQRDTKTAVDAALTAKEKAVDKQTEVFKESIAKSDAATNKQIDQLQQLLMSTTAALSSKIDDIKERVLRIEGEGRGLKAAETTQQTSNMSVVSIVGLIVGTLIGIAGVITAIVSMQP